MTKIQALKAAVAYLLCEDWEGCNECYLCAVDCEAKAREAAAVIKNILLECGYPHSGDRSGND